MSNKSGTTIDDLAVMVQTGFGGVEKRLNNLKEGQEEIKLKLDNVAYRFELVELQRRVELLEKKVGMQK
ncbi:MAG: hypothetical protein A3B10_00200 [Candidatus Doudnabacteria bacterium RIFCSPLOWO2_01_FULL_44_21]|uniref:Uncharacterized protein n=1 Tax=Candidatus Doudnabacteria bacterium RIFCSPLOWO2_01_FULL_44_21 TaxID=1817841 RepID=A0A1F5PXD2_9BACT|nr:MAG: hypothetical protein A3B95_03655 [Candidatus Doudnabacteria bacterium RIFCSPHIGHO2_02_FULL_43_13b]OGE94569.1 MAG: hypothetical protein A3B10_00200 [Candidatus Doudnabacteria bacterium RIFCSPLOWO2_01_FULL_44_21]